MKSRRHIIDILTRRRGRRSLPAFFAGCLLVVLAAAGMTACKGTNPEVASISWTQEQDEGENAETAPDSEPQVPVRIHFNSPREMVAYMDASPDSARYRRGIMHRMAQDAPEYVDSLLNSHCRKFLVADKSRMRVFLYDSCGKVLVWYKMAAAKKYGNKHKKGDSRTPEGFFRVEGIYDSTEWLYTDDDGVTSDVKGQYGPRFIRVKTTPRRWPIGIHGTNAPWSVGGRRSHGCMRLTNDDILALVEQVEPGMPVIIAPSRRDQQVNEEEGMPTRMVWTGDAYPERGLPVKSETPKDSLPSQSKDTLEKEDTVPAQTESLPAAEPQSESEPESSPQQSSSSEEYAAE